MVLKLSDLVKKSIDKGYGSAIQTIEKPWMQGNLSSIDLKTGNNPFIKITPIKCLQVTPSSSNDSLHEETFAFVPAGANLKQPNRNNTININPKSVSKPKSDKNWWENINFSSPAKSTQTMRLLVNYNLLCDEA